MEDTKFTQHCIQEIFLCLMKLTASLLRRCTSVIRLPRYSLPTAPAYTKLYLQSLIISREMSISAALQSKLDAIPDVDIDSDGRYKYVLIKVTATKDSTEIRKNIVRGYSWADYHADIYDSVSERVEPLGLDCQCLGGGRILTSAANKTIEVFGYSIGFGKADHAVTCEVIKSKYSDYKITWNNEGY